jgi:hypothetical protein
MKRDGRATPSLFYIMTSLCLTQQKTYLMSYLDMYRVYECLYTAYQSVHRQSRNRRFLYCTRLGARVDTDNFQPSFNCILHPVPIIHTIRSYFLLLRPIHWLEAIMIIMFCIIRVSQAKRSMTYHEFSFDPGSNFLDHLAIEIRLVETLIQLGANLKESVF